MNTNEMLLQAFLQVVIAVAVPVLVALFGMLIQLGIKRMRLVLSAEQLAFMRVLVVQFAKAAEQYNLSGAVKLSGAEKKQWVIARVMQELRERNINLDVKVIADQIESVCLDEFRKIDFGDIFGAAGLKPPINPADTFQESAGKADDAAHTDQS